MRQFVSANHSPERDYAQRDICAEIHDRMPVILPPPTWPLGENAAGAEELKAVLRPYPAEDMTCWPVSKAVGNVRNNDPSLIERVSL